MNFLVIPIIWCVDQFTKKKAEERLSTKERAYAFDNKVSFRVVYNKGAFLGLFKDQPRYLHFFTILALLMILIMGVPYWLGGKGRVTGLGLSMIFSGAMGNYTDRLKRGQVVDFIAFAPNHKVHFNIADFAIFIGAGLIVIGELLGQ